MPSGTSSHLKKLKCEWYYVLIPNVRRVIIGRCRVKHGMGIVWTACNKYCNMWTQPNRHGKTPEQTAGDNLYGMACNDKLIYACLRRQTRHRVVRHVNVAERTRKNTRGNHRMQTSYDTACNNKFHQCAWNMHVCDDKHGRQVERIAIL